VPSDLYHYLDAQTTSPSLTVNGTPVAFQLTRGYAHIQRQWQPGDQVVLSLPMSVRRVGSHPKLTDNVGRVAIERGPILYCAEEADNQGGMDDYHLPDNAEWHQSTQPDFLGGCITLRTELGRDKLGRDETVTLIPYHLWGHRGLGQMAVWLKRV
jgi:DUF1680 family protein